MDYPIEPEHFLQAGIVASMPFRANTMVSQENVGRSIGGPDHASSTEPRLYAGKSQDSGPAEGIQLSFTQGEFQVDVISDGYIAVPGDVFAPGVTNEARQDVLKRLETYGGVVHAPANIPMLRSRSDVILFDVGAGRGYQATDGLLQNNLEAFGIDERAITKIVFTHAHPDHIAATLTDSGGLRFPNATYFVGATEWDFWMDPDFFTNMPAALHDFGRSAQRDLAAIEHRMVLLRNGDDVVSGIRAVGTPGHTPGHLSFEISGGDGLLITADAATSEVVAFEHPDWKFGYDVDAELAIKSRKRLLDQAAHDRSKLLGFHWRYPGVGFAQATGGAYRFIPA
ncbi:MAG: MBL fold metallo-hydrolase [Bradyrhizobium sp.]